MLLMKAVSCTGVTQILCEGQHHRLCGFKLHGSYGTPSHFAATRQVHHEALCTDDRPVAVHAKEQTCPARFQGSYSLVRRSISGEIESDCNKGELGKALDIMDKQHLALPSEVYIVLLRTCTKVKSLVQAKRVHSHIEKYSLEFTSDLSEYVVESFVRCGGLRDANRVFQGLQNRTARCWAALVSGYSKTHQSQEVLRLLFWMRQEGTQPNKQIFISALKACGSLHNLEGGKHIHAEALMYGLDSDLVVGTCLVDMYAKCGCISEAENVFHSMPLRDPVLWTTMIGAYVQCGQASNALQLYVQLQEQGESPDAWTYATVVQACGMLSEKEVTDSLSSCVGSLQKGKAIHAYIREIGYLSDAFVGSSLISLYSKYNSIVDAQIVFDSLLPNDVVLWNTMLAGYVLQDMSKSALELYVRMLEEGVSPDDRTFVGVLQACGSLAEKGGPMLETIVEANALQKGKALHSEALRAGNASDVFVGNALISMYGKCGSVEDATTAFYSCSQRNVVSWNTMLTELLQNGHAERTLQLYDKMLGEGVTPDSRTFISIVQACGVLADEVDIGLTGVHFKSPVFLQKGKVIHAEAWWRGYDSNNFLGSTLISLYGNCGAIAEAEIVFNRVSNDNVVLWNAMLAGYVTQELAEEAFILYDQMSQAAVSPDGYTFVNMLQVCGQLAEKEEARTAHGQLLKLQSLQKGKAIHAESLQKHYSSNLFVLNALVAFYGRCGSIVDAENIFGALLQCDIVSWNALLSAYVQHGEAEKTVQLYAQMLEEGVVPDAWSFVSILQACAMLEEEKNLVKYLQQVQVVHYEAWRVGYMSDAFVASILISSYGRTGCIGNARDVLKASSKRDVVPWNAMLAVYAQHGKGEDVLQLYRQMLDEGMILTETTIVSILQACSITGCLDVCNQICDNFVSTRTVFNYLVGNAFVHTYGKCARMDNAQWIFDSLLQKDVVSWNALIAGYARQGNYEAAESWYKIMVQAGVVPDGITFLSLISACGHVGMVQKGLKYFEIMTREYRLLPEIEHYVGMVDMLGRAGCFTSVEFLLSTMWVPPNQALWLCLLAACRKHSNVIMGEQAFQRAVHLQPTHAAAYVVMSNIYANVGMVEAAKRVDKLRRQAGAVRKLGQSWMEHKQEVRSFTASDCEGRQQVQMYKLSERLNLH